MLFHIFNIEQKSDTEVYLYGKYQENTTPGMQTVKVSNIISPIYFLPTSKCDEFLISEIKSYITKIKENETEKIVIERVKRQNIFHKAIQKSLELLKISFSSKISFENFESEFCEMIFTEFQNPIENLVISKKIMGPGIVELSNISKNTVDFNDIKFIKNEKFPDFQIVSIAVETIGGNISKFVYFNKKKQQLICAKLQSQNNIEPNYKIFNEHREIYSFLNETIKKDNPDVVVYHNIHSKYKLNLKDKIVCDIYSFAQGTIKARDFSIQELCSIYRINKSKGLEGDAKALIDIMEAMNALDLAKEMAEISGYLLNKCLNNSRAERIEYTLLHELYSKDYIFPPNTPKMNVKYSGGLVLEPQRGFYEDIILLLDFNSLYPSIIQEFNVCFSTIGSSAYYITNENADDLLNEPDLLSSMADTNTDSFLPKILRNFVKRRRSVKEILKNTKNPEERTVLDIRQKALKLTANSIYGCLGFTGSRFCNFEMAAFITAKGRELLNGTKIAAEELGMKVIYGDTDSIMIHTKYPGSKEYYGKAVESAKALVNKINQKYNNIEIELEKVFKKLILYTKKKYAALVFDMNGSNIETKGIDIVRRDFCSASIDLGRMVLNVMLDDKEEYYKKNHVEINILEEDQSKIFKNNTKNTAELIYKICIDFYSTLCSRPVDDFIISSALSRDINSYSNISNLPHVSLALRLKNTKNIVYLQDDVISYVIGEGEGPISTRAFHPDEKFSIDYQYYIKNQILPSLYRLISPLTFIHTDKIGMIFGVKDFTPKIIQNVMTFILPCCQNVQEPTNNCSKCGSEIPVDFYISKINIKLQESILNLYKEKGKCPDCGLEYSNHLLRCFECQKELVFDLKNHEFDAYLSSVESSFANLNMPEIKLIISNYSEISAYRRIEMHKYFTILN